MYQDESNNKCIKGRYLKNCDQILSLCFIIFVFDGHLIFIQLLHSNAIHSINCDIGGTRDRDCSLQTAIAFAFCIYFRHQHSNGVHKFLGRALREEGCACCHHCGPCPSVLWKVNDVWKEKL